MFSRVIIMLTVALLLAGCQALAKLSPITTPAVTETVTNNSDGSETITETIGTATSIPVPQPTAVPWCIARARHFNGFVQVPCADLAREIRP